MTNVLVVGSVNMDLVMKAPRLPSPGETLIGGRFSIVPGGKGANQAASAARLGCSVRLLAAVGEDDFGAAALANLREQGVDAAAVRTAPAGISTGVAMIMVDAAGRNTILVASGANATLAPDDVAAVEVLFAWAGIVVLQCEVPLPTVTAVVAAARRAGATVILNAAPAPSGPIDDCLAVDYLVVNEQEAAALSGIHPGSPAEAARAAAALLERGPAHVVVTLGAAGCVHVHRESARHILAPAVEAIDTTAAGDAFVGALAAALGAGRPTVEALLYANCAGALAVTKLGAQSSLPDAASVAALFDRVHPRLSARPLPL